MIVSDGGILAADRAPWVGARLRARDFDAACPNKA
jgi:hypothetical protein